MCVAAVVEDGTGFGARGSGHRCAAAVPGDIFIPLHKHRPLSGQAKEK